MNVVVPEDSLANGLIPSTDNMQIEQVGNTPPPPPSPPSYLYLDSTSEQPTIIGTAGTQPMVFLRSSSNSLTPYLVLSNNRTKGTMEANVLLENSTPTFIRLSGQLQAMAHANLIAQTQENIARQLGDGVDDGGCKIEEDSGSLQINTGEIDEQKEQTKPTGNKIYFCDMVGCGKTFTSVGYKKFHQTSQGHHTIIRVMECPYDGCTRKFDRLAHYKYHVLTHTNDRQYECRIGACTKRFLTAQRLKVHMRVHTGEKPFICSDCGKSFTTAGNLKNHERIHSGERPFVCDIEGCLRKFSECSSLKKHKLVHTGEKPFECNICLKTFSQSGSRKVHMKRHEVGEGDGVLHNFNTKPENSDEEIANNSQSKIITINEVAAQFQVEAIHQTHSVVLGQSLSDHIVTVATQPADKIDIPCRILDAEVSLQSQEKTVSVVVLSQPQEIVTLPVAYRQIAGREEIIYENNLLHTELDHEEIAHSEFSLQSLTQGSQGSTDMVVGDSIMAGDESTDIASSSQAGKEMAMDPMMESDDDIDHLDEDLVEKV